MSIYVDRHMDTDSLWLASCGAQVSTGVVWFITHTVDWMLRTPAHEQTDIDHDWGAKYVSDLTLKE